jgi:hypothetical protein
LLHGTTLPVFEASEQLLRQPLAEGPRTDDILLTDLEVIESSDADDY